MTWELEFPLYAMLLHVLQYSVYSRFNGPLDEVAACSLTPHRDCRPFALGDDDVALTDLLSRV